MSLITVQKNQEITKAVLHVYADSSKHLGTNKIAYILNRDYGIHIYYGRVYCLIKNLQLPEISSDQPRCRCMIYDNIYRSNHPCRKFN